MLERVCVDEVSLLGYYTYGTWRHVVASMVYPARDQVLVPLVGVLGRWIRRASGTWTCFERVSQQQISTAVGTGCWTARSKACVGGLHDIGVPQIMARGLLEKPIYPFLSGTVV